MMVSYVISRLPLQFLRRLRRKRVDQPALTDAVAAGPKTGTTRAANRSTCSNQDLVLQRTHAPADVVL
jgi:hypothetical protein